MTERATSQEDLDSSHLKILKTLPKLRKTLLGSIFTDISSELIIQSPSGRTVQLPESTWETKIEIEAEATEEIEVETEIMAAPVIEDRDLARTVVVNVVIVAHLHSVVDPHHPTNESDDPDPNNFVVYLSLPN